MKINREVIAAVIIHARKEAPLEVCGYLAEREGVVVRHYPLTNADASEEHYSLLPEEQFAAVRQMRAGGMKLRAIYHSHPSTEARPSEEDIRLAYDPEISYVIVSLAGENEKVNAFRIKGPLVEKEEIEVVESSVI